MYTIDTYIEHELLGEIPVRATVTHYTPFMAPITDRDPDFCDPGQDEEIEYELFTVDGTQVYPSKEEDLRITQELSDLIAKGEEL